MNEPISPFRVLVVEDNPHVTELFGYAFRRMSRDLLGDGRGIELEEASDGHSALSLLESESEDGKPFDLVVLDLMLPVMDGFEFLSRARAQPLLASTPVLVVTAAGQEACSAATERGATEVLRKPVQLEQIRAALRRILDGDAARAAADEIRGSGSD